MTEHLSIEVRTALETDLTIDITTTGRQSGEPRRIEIWFVNVDDVIYITGTPGPRDWLANLAADPAFVFHLKESVEADLDAVAAFVDDPDERRRVFESTKSDWYRDNAPFAELLATAPLVRVRFPPPPAGSTRDS